MGTVIQLDRDDLHLEIRDAIREILTELRETPYESNELPENGGVELACSILNRSKSYVYKAVSAGKLPYKKFGSSVIFNREELYAWMSKQTIDPIASRESSITTNLRRSASKKLQ